MPAQSITLRNKRGLHARAAGKLVQCAAAFTADVHLTRDERRVNAKSIMGVLMLAAPCGSDLLLECEGEDAQAAFEALTLLIESRFGEDE